VLAAGGVDVTSLREVRLVFDLTEAGTVVVDDLGFSNLDPAFLSADRPAGSESSRE